MAPTVPTASSFRQSPDTRLLLSGPSGSRLPLKWRQPRPPSMNRTHLPVDALAHSLLFILGPSGSLPLPLTSSHLVDYLPPTPAEGRSYPQLKAVCCARLLDEWKASSPAPERYPFPPSMKPHPFMGLPKFEPGRIHQMGSGKSYLAAHPSWFDETPNRTCPRCISAPETMEHAVLHCPARQQARDHYLQGVSCLGPDAPIWSSVPLLRALYRFLRATKTAFPPRMVDNPGSSPPRTQSLSPDLLYQPLSSPSSPASEAPTPPRERSSPPSTPSAVPL